MYLLSDKSGDTSHFIDVNFHKQYKQHEIYYFAEYTPCTLRMSYTDSGIQSPRRCRLRRVPDRW